MTHALEDAHNELCEIHETAFLWWKYQNNWVKKQTIFIYLSWNSLCESWFLCKPVEFLPNALMGEIVEVVSSFHMNTFSSSATKHPYDLHYTYTHKKY